MAKTIFIIGAGASVQGGAPVMADFVDRARDLLASDSVGDAKPHFELVFKALTKLQRVHHKARLDYNNIETLFEACEMGKTLSSFPGFTAEEIPQVIESLKEFIVVVLEQTL